MDLDPASRTAAEERLALLYDLRRKYGDSLEAVIAFEASAADELARLEDQEGERERLRAEEAERRATLEAEAAKLHAARRAAADRLAAARQRRAPAARACRPGHSAWSWRTRRSGREAAIG